MKSVIVLGAGQIGIPVATLLATVGNFSVDHEIHLVDSSGVPEIEGVIRHGDEFQLIKPGGLAQYALEAIINDIANPVAIISCLPYFCNRDVAQVAQKLKLHYFDLTEDVDTSAFIKKIAEDSSTTFIPQCGLAPGFVSLLAGSLMEGFDSLDEVNLRVGALPRRANNDLKYALTWSTNGVINECGNECLAIEDGKIVKLKPLEGLEHIILDGIEYEAFNTSGGIGTLLEDYQDKVKLMNYKTMRYPGHHKLFKFLLFDMKLNKKREIFETLLDDAIPTVMDDVVIVFVSVTGMINGKLTNRTEHVVNHGLHGADSPLPELSAIQLTTAAGVCGVVDIVLNNESAYGGFCKVENISYDEFINNQFGRLYKVQ